jgi:hypothetical protein
MAENPGILPWNPNQEYDGYRPNFWWLPCSYPRDNQNPANGGGISGDTGWRGISPTTPDPFAQPVWGDNTRKRILSQIPCTGSMPSVGTCPRFVWNPEGGSGPCKDCYGLEIFFNDGRFWLRDTGLRPGGIREENEKWWFLEEFIRNTDYPRRKRPSFIPYHPDLGVPQGGSEGVPGRNIQSEFPGCTSIHLGIEDITWYIEDPSGYFDNEVRALYYMENSQARWWHNGMVPPCFIRTPDDWICYGLTQGATGTTLGTTGTTPVPSSTPTPPIAERSTVQGNGAGSLKAYDVFDIRANYIDASGQYGTEPFSPLGTAAGLEVIRSKDPNLQTISAYVPFDEVGLSFAAGPTAASEYVFRNYLGNTGGTASPRPGTLLEGYGLIDISQSNQYLDLVGSLSRGTATGANYNTAVTYVNSLFSRLNLDFPNVKWAIKGVPFNHYFLIPSQVMGVSGASGSSGATGPTSSFGSGTYFHPGHPSGDVNKVYDWTNGPSGLAQFYRDRSSAPLSDMSGFKWICPSGVVFFDNSLPFLRNTFDPETMYRANKECFEIAKDFADSSARDLKVIPFTSPIYQIRKSSVFDFSGGIGTGTSQNATPTVVTNEMFLYQVVQPMKDTNCDGLVLWNNLNCLCYNAATGASSSEQTTLARNFFSGLLYDNSIPPSSIWSTTLSKERNAYESGLILAEKNLVVGNSVQMLAGQQCCPGPSGPASCVECVCDGLENPNGLPLCSSDPIYEGCCSLSTVCAAGGVLCGELCDCPNDSCRYSPGAPGGNGCPPNFVFVNGCGGGLCNTCCSNSGSLDCLCCCSSVGFGEAFTSPYNVRRANDATVNWRNLYLLPSGGAYGSSRLSINKNTYFLKPSVVAGLDPLFTGQANFLNTNGSIL